MRCVGSRACLEFESYCNALFDPYAALAALEHLVDSAGEVSDENERAKRYAVIFRQCCPLVHNSATQSVLIKLVADKEEAEKVKDHQEAPWRLE